MSLAEDVDLGSRYGPSPDDCILVTSATQFEAFARCPRLWLFTWIWKLPVVQRNYFTFGTCLHAVLERYLRADDNGRTADGSAVELYPKDWQTTKDGTVTPNEAALIQRLVPKAIEQGIVERRPGRIVEKQFWLPMVEVAAGGKVYASGFIDMFLGDEIQDHKTTKDMKYAKSPAKLATNIQMNLYAAAAIDWARSRGQPAPETITLRHNVFCKNPSDERVKKVPVTVTRKAVEQFFTDLQDKAKRMYSLASRRPVSTSCEWHEVRGPDDMNVCNDYGGCQFLPICSGHESVAMYTDRVKRFNENGATNGSANGTKTGDRVMGFAQKLAEKAAKNSTLAGASAPPAGTQAAVNPPREAPPAQSAADLLAVELPARKRTLEQAIASGETLTGAEASAARAAITRAAETVSPPINGKPAAPPWARAGCPACTGTGFNSKGAPCRICDSLQRQASLVTSSMFMLVQEDGVTIWEPKAEHANEIAAAQKRDPTPTLTRVPAQAAPAPSAAPSIASGTPPVAAAVSAPASPAAPLAEAAEPLSAYESEDEADHNNPALAGSIKRGRGRPAKGFTLAINISVAKQHHTVKVIQLDEVLLRFGQAIAVKDRVESFYLLDPWKRRDMLALMASDIAEEFGTAMVIANGDNPDQKALRDAIRPLAACVFEGVR